MGGDGNPSEVPTPDGDEHGTDRRVALLRSLPSRLRPAVLAPLRRLGLRQPDPPVPYRSLVESAADSLGRLRAAGARIAIDDFGTGFSSLAWLERLPIDVLKIDRSFTQRLDCAADDTGVVRSVVAMAHNLGLTALAEGVETLHQLDQLRDLGYDLAQGYLLSRPAPAADVDPTEGPEVAAARAGRPEVSRPIGSDPVPV